MKSKTKIDMTNDQLFKALVSSQSTIKSELLSRINKLDVRIDKLENKMDKGFEDIKWRLDTLGKQLNELDEDAPTNQEFRKLEDRVEKIENQVFATL